MTIFSSWLESTVSEYNIYECVLSIIVGVSRVSQNEEESFSPVVSDTIVSSNKLVIGKTHKGVAFMLSLTVSKIDEVPLGVLTLMLEILDDVGISSSKHIVVGISSEVIESLTICPNSQNSVTQSPEIFIVFLVVEGESESDVPLLSVIS